MRRQLEAIVTSVHGESGGRDGTAGVLCEGPEGWEISGGSKAGTVGVPENLRPRRCPTKSLHR